MCLNPKSGSASVLVSASREPGPEVEARLVRAQAEGADLGAQNEALDAERDALSELLAAAEQQRDELSARRKSKRRTSDLERERAVLEAVRQEVATVSVKIEVHAEALAEMRARIAALTEDQAAAAAAR